MKVSAVPFLARAADRFKRVTVRILRGLILLELVEFIHKKDMTLHRLMIRRGHRVCADLEGVILQRIPIAVSFFRESYKQYCNFAHSVV